MKKEEKYEIAKSDTKVIASARGFYNGQVRTAGEVFILREGDAFGSWMDKADGGQPLGEPVEGTAKARPLYEQDRVPADAYADHVSQEKPLNKMNKAELVALATNEGVEVTPDSMTNKEIIEAIEKKRSETLL
jgi:hypothetical protein